MQSSFMEPLPRVPFSMTFQKILFFVGGWHPTRGWWDLNSLTRDLAVKLRSPNHWTAKRFPFPPNQSILDIPLRRKWVSLVAQMVKNLPAMQETQV